MAIKRWKSFFIDRPGNERYGPECNRVGLNAGDREEAIAEIKRDYADDWVRAFSLLRAMWNYAVECDGEVAYGHGVCGESLSCGQSKGAIIVEAQRYGYELIGGKWLCPNCVAAKTKVPA